MMTPVRWRFTRAELEPAGFVGWKPAGELTRRAVLGHRLLAAREDGVSTGSCSITWVGPDSRSRWRLESGVS